MALFPIEENNVARKAAEIFDEQGDLCELGQRLIKESKHEEQSRTAPKQNYGRITENLQDMMRRQEHNKNPRYDDQELVDIQIPSISGHNSRLYPNVTRSMRRELWLGILRGHNNKGYRDLLRIECDEKVVMIIERDIHRTFPGHFKFEDESDQKTLGRILKAYSLTDPEVQYCQGMNFIAGMLLMYLDEEQAYDAFIHVLFGSNLRELYKPSMEGVVKRLDQLSRLLGRRIPQLKSHLDSLGVAPLLYASSWFLTLFATEFPLRFALRVLDVVLSEGSYIVVMKIAIALLNEAAYSVLAINDFEKVVSFLRNDLAQIDLTDLHCHMDIALKDTEITEEFLESLENEPEALGSTSQDEKVRYSDSSLPSDIKTERKASSSTPSDRLTNDFPRAEPSTSPREPVSPYGEFISSQEATEISLIDMQPLSLDAPSNSNSEVPISSQNAASPEVGLSQEEIDRAYKEAYLNAMQTQGYGRSFSPVSGSSHRMPNQSNGPINMGIQNVNGTSTYQPRSNTSSIDLYNSAPSSSSASGIRHTNPGWNMNGSVPHSQPAFVAQRHSSQSMPHLMNHSSPQVGSFQASPHHFGNVNSQQTSFIEQYGSSQQSMKKTAPIRYEDGLQQIEGQIKSGTELGNDWFDQLLKECKSER